MEDDMELGPYCGKIGLEFKCTGLGCRVSGFRV